MINSRSKLCNVWRFLHSHVSAPLIQKMEGSKKMCIYKVSNDMFRLLTSPRGPNLLYQHGTINWVMRKCPIKSWKRKLRCSIHFICEVRSSNVSGALLSLIFEVLGSISPRGQVNLSEVFLSPGELLPRNLDEAVALLPCIREGMHTQYPD
jgi:hypothetical protein